jgi:hypothetical protein
VNTVIDSSLLPPTVIGGSEIWHIGPFEFGHFLLLHKLILQVLKHKFFFSNLLSIFIQRWEDNIKMGLWKMGLEGMD